MFNPADGATETGVAVTDEGGRFQVDRVSGRKGLLTGKYTILLGAPEGADRASFFKTIPNEYYDGGVLNADVQEGMSPLALRIQPRKRN